MTNEDELFEKIAAAPGHALSLTEWPMIMANDVSWGRISLM